mgnify:CR=1 FL=1
MKLYKGECLEVMKSIPDASIDAIITDPPYGTTACKWDSVIPFDLMWEQLNRIIKPNGAIVLTASQPFTSALVMSNVKMFRHSWVYQKRCATNFAQAKYQPMKENEDILVFGKSKVNYYPIKEERVGGGKERMKHKFNPTKSGEFTSIKNATPKFSELRYPSSIQLFNNRAKGQRGSHPTQKPIALMEYLIKTYTNENETVLDFTMGSGSTGVACVNTKRNFIGIEMDSSYFEIAEQRIKEAEFKLF